MTGQRKEGGRLSRAGALLLRSVGFWCLLWLFCTFDYRAVLRLFTEVDGLLALEVSLLVMLLMALKFARWQGIVGMNGFDVPAGPGLPAYATGIFWGLVSPGRLGEFVRCLPLKREFGIPYGSSAALIVADRLNDVLSLVFCLALGLALVSGLWGPALLAGLLLPVLIVTGRSMLAGGIPGAAAHFLQRRGVPCYVGSVKRILLNMTGARALIPFAWTLMSFLVLVWQVHVLAREGFGLPFTFAQAFFITAALSWSSLLPLSVFGFGTNEMTLLGLVHTWMPACDQPDRVIAFSLCLSLINFLTTTTASGLLAATGRLLPVESPVRAFRGVTGETAGEGDFKSSRIKSGSTR